MKRRSTMTEILSKINLTKKRIAQAVIIDELSTTSSLINFRKKSETKINGMEIKDVEENIRATYAGMNALLENLKFLNLIKNGVNATVQITIAGKKMTISEALSYNAPYIREYSNSIVDKMRKDYTNALRLKKRYDDEKFSDAAINEYLKVTLGSSSEELKKTNPDLVQNYIKQYNDMHDLELVDPLNITQEINNRAKGLEDFYDEFNFITSMINSRIIVEYDLDDPEMKWEIVNLDEINRLDEYANSSAE